MIIRTHKLEVKIEDKWLDLWKGRFPQSTHIPQLWRILDEDWNGELLEIES